MFDSYIAYGENGILVDNLFENGFCSNEDSNVVCKEEKNQCLECSCSSDKEITSPNFPDKYPKNLEMTWLIKFPPGQRIRINFHEFEFSPANLNAASSSHNPREDSDLQAMTNNFENQ